MKTMIALASLAFATSAQAVLFTQWNFNNADNIGTTGTLTPNVGLGSATLVGGATATFASGNAGTGSTDPLTTVDDTAWNLSTWAAQGTGSGTRGAQFAVSTLGQKDIVVSWDQRHSNTSSKFVQFQYSTDGTTFSSASLLNNGVFSAAAGDVWNNGRSVDLSAIAAVNNNANFAFRVVTIFDPAGTGYVASTAGSTYGVTSTQRFDMVTVNANPVPEPASMLALGLGAVAMMRRRK